MSAADSFDMQAWGPQANSRRVVKQYPSGSKVMVYYDPQNPANAVLRHDLNSPTGQGLVLSVVLVDMVAIAAIGYTLFNLL